MKNNVKMDRAGDEMCLMCVVRGRNRQKLKTWETGNFLITLFFLLLNFRCSCWFRQTKSWVKSWCDDSSSHNRDQKRMVVTTCYNYFLVWTVREGIERISEERNWENKWRGIEEQMMRENDFEGSWESWNHSRRTSFFVVFCDNLTLNSLFLSSSHHHQLDSWWNIPFFHSSFSSHPFSIFPFLHLRKETMKCMLWYRNGN